MIEDHFVGGIRRRFVNLSGDAFAGQVAVLGIKFLADGGSRPLKFRRRRQIESTEEHGAVLQHLFANEVAVVRGPLCEIEIRDRRADD